MKHMKSLTRTFTHPKSGKVQMITYKYHPCEGVSTFGKNKGQPCKSPQTNQVGDHWYCPFHHPDKSKRRISPALLMKQRTGAGPNSKKSFSVQPVAPDTSPGTTFATSLSEIIDQMAKESLRKHLSTLVAELEK